MGEPPLFNIVISNQQSVVCQQDLRFNNLNLMDYCVSSQLKEQQL